jgi:GAF domain-containing protein
MTDTLPSSHRPATDPRAMAERLADAARVLIDEPTAQQTFDRIVALAVDMVPGCTAAGISQVTRKGIHTPAATSDTVRAGDQMQYDLDEGPCIDAIREQELVLSGDVEVDARWPRWGPAVTSTLGVRSMMCFRLYTSETKHGAINLYSEDREAFSADDEPMLAMFAGVAAAAMTSAETQDQLTSAIATRMVIGQAQGILMERFRISPANAFAVMSRLSQDTNTKLATVAQEIVATGTVPGTTR